MITLDASLVIAHLEPSEQHHPAASTFLRDHAHEPFLMHSLTVTEVLVGAVATGRGQELLDDLRAIGVQVADRDDGEPLRLATLRSTTGLKLPDCCALDTALQSGSMLGTLDLRLASVARARHLRVGPLPG